MDRYGGRVGTGSAGFGPNLHMHAPAEHAAEFRLDISLAELRVMPEDVKHPRETWRCWLALPFALNLQIGRPPGLHTRDAFLVHNPIERGKNRQRLRWSGVRVPKHEIPVHEPTETFIETTERVEKRLPMDDGIQIDEVSL